MAEKFGAVEPRYTWGLIGVVIRCGGWSGSDGVPKTRFISIDQWTERRRGAPPHMWWAAVVRDRS